MKDERKEKDSIVRQSALYLQLGTVLIAPVLLGAFIGYWADKKLKTEPWLMLTGSILGIVGGFYEFFRIVLSKNKK